MWRSTRDLLPTVSDDYAVITKQYPRSWDRAFFDVKNQQWAVENYDCPAPDTRIIDASSDAILYWMAIPELPC